MAGILEKNLSVWLISVLLGGAVAGQSVLAQSGSRSAPPSIGFRPFDTRGGQSPTIPPAGSVTGFSRSAGQDLNGSNGGGSATRSVYPYPGSSTAGAVGSVIGGTPERASINNRISSPQLPTGGLNRGTGLATSPVPSVVPPAANANAQLLQQQQLAQYRQFLQWQQWQAVQANRQQAVAQSTSAGSGTRAPAVAPRVAPRLNQSVVQQVSSTASIGRDVNVARANFDRGLSAPRTAARGVSLATTAARPQCCCVPTQNRNNYVPITAQNFRAQPADQIPTLNSAASGTLVAANSVGQSGLGFQSNQPGFQFQPGLGVPQFTSTGASGSGGWFSNLIRGTGVYQPLLPVESVYPNARPGRGVIGQPTAYVDGQPLRNLLRYFAP